SSKKSLEQPVRANIVANVYRAIPNSIFIFRFLKFNVNTKTDRLVLGASGISSSIQALFGIYALVALPREQIVPAQIKPDLVYENRSQGRFREDITQGYGPHPEIVIVKEETGRCPVELI